MQDICSGSSLQCYLVSRAQNITEPSHAACSLFGVIRDCAEKATGRVEGKYKERDQIKINWGPLLHKNIFLLFLLLYKPLS